MNRIWTLGFTSAIAGWSLLMIVYGFASGIRHDYGWYLEQWQLVTDGLDPWSTVADNGNAYGPIHALLAFTTPFGVLAPKIVMTVAFATANLLLVLHLLKVFPRPNPNILALYVLIIPLNAIIFVGVFRWGDNDALAAALVAFAVLARFRRSFFLAGVFLGLAVLMKYYPALLIPFFALDNRKMNWSLMLGSILTIAIGFAATWLVWGTGFLAALTFGAERRPNLMSFFVYVESQLSHSWMSLGISHNSILVGAVAVATWLAAYFLRLNWIEGASLALISSLLFYKIGHTQFYITWLILLVGLLIADTKRSRHMIYICIPFTMYLSGFQLLFSSLWDSGLLFTDGLYLFAISWLPTLIISSLTIVVTYFYLLFQDVRSRNTKANPAFT